MSSVSETSSKIEKSKSNLMEELESIKILNKTLEEVLQHYRTFKQGLSTMSDNMEELSGQNEKLIKHLATAGQ